MDCAQAKPLLDAYCDGELSAGEAAGVEQHVRACAKCRARVEAQRALSSAVRRHATYHGAPDTLRARLRRELPTETTLAGARRSWRQIGAGLAAGVVATLAAQVLWMRHAGDGALTAEIVADHVRSLQANHLADVASTDQHTVKPWFAGKLDYSPPVRDLRSEGFPLEGGRLDHVDGRDVAALIYRRHQHVINVFVWPDTGASAPAALSRDGYNLLHWTQDGMHWWAVSELNAAELQEFVHALRTPAPAG